MRAERLAAFVAIEQRRKDLERQRGGDERRRRGQRIEDDRPGAFRRVRLFVQLPVALRKRRLRARRGVAVDPFGAVDQRAHVAHLPGGQNIWNGDQHATFPCRSISGPCSANPGTSERRSHASALSRNEAIAVSPARASHTNASSTLPASPSIRAWLKQPRKSPPSAARA